MTKREQFHKDCAPIRMALKGWAFATVERRRAQIDRAKTLVPTLPEYVREWAHGEIIAVEVHCGRD